MRNIRSEVKKVAIVTGASRGIGAAIARRLSGDGYAVVVNYANDADSASAIVHWINSKEGRSIAIRGDVSNSSEVAKIFDLTEREFGRIDVVVNSAGVMAGNLPLLENISDEEFDRIFAINVKGTFNTLREAARRLETGGAVVNVSSSVVGTAPPGYSVYAASKAAIETMTLVFARELRGRNITVNAVAPGPTATDLFFNGKNPDQIDKIAKVSPLERLGEPQDIANAVAFLVGADGAWVNGQTLRVNGGMV